MTPRPFLVRLVATAASVVVCGLGAANAAQPVTASDVKAAFIYNFAKFAEWPAEALGTDRTLQVCVLGDLAVAGALEATARGHAIDGRELRVRTVMADDPFASCRLLYVSGVDSTTTARLLDGVGTRPVLTISDDESFAASGGIAELFVENGRMRFAINVMAARRAGITLSAKILSLAKLVKDDRHAPR